VPIGGETLSQPNSSGRCVFRYACRDGQEPKEEEPVRHMRLAVPAVLGWLAASALSGAPAVGGAEPTVVINEIRATGRDWVELFNAAAEPADVSGWRLADCDSQGRPRLDTAVRLPRGTILAPHTYLLVISDRRGKKWKEAAETRDLCAPRGAVPCVKSAWGVSQKRGDTVRLIALDGGVRSEASFPAHTVPKGRSWARHPDGVGAFGVADPTPGRTNAPPPEK
jgi:hypothetical protein